MDILSLANTQLKRKGKLNKYSEETETALLIIEGIKICKRLDIFRRNKKVALARRIK